MSRKAFQHLSDEALLKHYRETRKPAVFHLLYARHKDALYRYCVQLAPVSTEQLLRSLWQEILERPPQLDRQLLRNWLFIQVNKLLSKQACRSREVQTHHRTQQRTVLSTIQKLPAKQRNVLLLFVECRLSLAAIADIERISLKTCRELYHSAREAVETQIYGTRRKPWQIQAIEE
ncbi:sigma factor-like helix-turn-helix DNA-binding protein [uncultured Microbulbifer sp.]|uniref:RNA polymerase sigma factor n=1 Tax=uncultured Microbulbifer sp. TaxID=348147 RepID=UPI0026390CCA|nr:sigma factor-like helix-turn-helix DNA-binding protein [uncultured Microbulbifer sp.]